LRILSERFERSAPFCRSIAQSFNSNAARQATFDRCSDEIRCERERNPHIDLTHTAFLAYRDLLDSKHRARTRSRQAGDGLGQSH
jgi:hypothetical protein